MTEIKNTKNVTFAHPPQNRIISNLTDQRFEMLTVFGYVGRTGKKQAYAWLCRCDCGAWNIATSLNLQSGNSTNCGCVNNKRIGSLNRTHGLANKSAEYCIWKHIRSRCYNPKHPRYKDYGERGITICDRWRESFANFLQDMGERPGIEYTIERKDNEKGYSPDNCKWATRAEQNNNKRNNRRIAINGRTLNLSQWCKELQISRQSVHYRLNQGMSIIEALTAPKESRYCK